MQKLYNPILDETLICETLACGLSIYVAPKSGFSKTYAYFGVNYGALDTAFEVGDQAFVHPQGTAHFLEHQVFENQKESIFKTFNQKEAQVNAYTNFTSTVYHFSCTNHFEDNLANLLAMVQSLTIHDQGVKKEQGVIEQEINMYEDQPDWVLYFETLKALYKDHPVQYNIAGSVGSINEINTGVLEEAYTYFYSPKNSFVLIVGHVDPRQVIDLVNANLTEGFKQRQAKAKPIIPLEQRHVNQQKRDLTFNMSYPKYFLAFKDDITHLEGDERLHHAMTSKVMNDLFFGKTSYAYNHLYQTGLINAAFGYDYIYDKNYAFTLIGGEGKDPDAVYHSVFADVEDMLVHDGIKDRFDQVKKKMIGRFLMSMSSLDFIGHHYVSHLAKGMAPLKYLQIIEGITLEEVVKRFKDHVTVANCSFVVMRPK